MLFPVAGAGANVALTQVSADPFTNATSQHGTELEPDTFAFGSTVVGAFQVGRFFNGGASDIGFVRSGDGGHTWDAPGFLPGLTFNSGSVGSPYERVSDSSVAYDARHATWLISSIPLTPSLVVPLVYVNRSTDDGRTWGAPVTIPPPADRLVNLDKNWTVCDNHTTSRYYGHCYTELDNFAGGDVELMSTSTDSGLTWSVPIATAGPDKGLGGQPMVQPDGTVVVPFESLNGKIEAFTSVNGGASWTGAQEPRVCCLAEAQPGSDLPRRSQRIRTTGRLSSCALPRHDLAAQRAPAEARTALRIQRDRGAAARSFHIATRRGAADNLGRSDLAGWRYRLFACGPFGTAPQRTIG